MVLVMKLTDDPFGGMFGLDRLKRTLSRRENLVANH